MRHLSARSLALALMTLVLFAPLDLRAASAPLTVAEFVSAKPSSGTFALIAYIIDVYVCPPCPPGAECKPCIPDNISIADKPPRAGTPGGVEGEKLRVYIPAELAPNLKVGKRYELKVLAGASPRLLAASERMISALDHSMH